MDRLRAFADGEGVHASIDTTGAVAGRATAVNALRVTGVMSRWDWALIRRFDPTSSCSGTR